LGRVINPDTAGKERVRLSKSIVLALRELSRQTEPNQETRDLAAYIALALASIIDTIELSVGAWEKRGYWVKADRYRMEWIWAEKLSQQMRSAVLADNWNDIALLAVTIAGKLASIRLSDRHRLGRPWIGAWALLKNR
jgi:hypothetical protein